MKRQFINKKLIGFIVLISALITFPQMMRAETAGEARAVLGYGEGQIRNLRYGLTESRFTPNVALVREDGRLTHHIYDQGTGSTSNTFSITKSVYEYNLVNAHDPLVLKSEKIISGNVKKLVYTGMTAGGNGKQLPLKVTLEPNSSQSAVVHTFEVTNNTKDPQELYPIKHVETKLGDGPRSAQVAIRSIGPGEGMYIIDENGKYRLDYHTDVPNGPDAYFGRVYSSIPNYFVWEGPKYGDLNMEDTQKPEDSIIKENAYTGLFLVWRPLTLEPGETFVGSYSVGVRELKFGMSQRAKNNSGATLYKVGDTVDYSVTLTEEKGDFDNISIQTELPTGIDKPRNVKMTYKKDLNSREITEDISIDSIYEESNHRLNFERPDTYMVRTGGFLQLDFQATINVSAASKTISSSSLGIGYENPSGIRREVVTGVDINVEKEIPRLWGTSPWTFAESSGTLTLQTGTLSSYTDAPWNRIDELKIDPKKIKEIVFAGDIVAPSNSQLLFNTTEQNEDGLINLERLTGIETLDTSNVQSMEGMFTKLPKLKSLNLTTWKTSKVSNMKNMFNGLLLSDIKGIDSFNTANVTTMEGMFMSMSIVERLDLGRWTTNRLTTTKNMFNGDGKLVSLNFNNWRTTSQTNMLGMFTGTYLLNELTLGANFKFTKAADLQPVPNNTLITGQWQGVGTSKDRLHPTGSTIKTSAELMSDYNGTTMADTYIWRPKKARDITVIYENEKGESLASSLPNKIVAGKNVDEAYDVSTADFTPTLKDHVLDTSQLPKNAKGKFSHEKIVVKYVYKFRKEELKFNSVPQKIKLEGKVSDLDNTPLSLDQELSVYDSRTIKHWKLKVVTSDLKAGKQTLNGVYSYTFQDGTKKDLVTNNELLIDSSSSASKELVKDVSKLWGKDKGLRFRNLDNSGYINESYIGEITWLLEDTPG